MSRRKPVSDLHAHLGYRLRMVSNAVSQTFARGVEREGVTVAEWVFLRMLYGAAPIAPSSLAERMGMTKGAISKLADRLVRKNLVARQPNPDGPRGQTLALEPSGRALVPRLAELADQNDAAFFGCLDPGERDQLHALLQKIASTRQLSNVPTD
jgi:DNA-binding MarR family transcriptional regulator